METFFEVNNAPTPPNYNPADHYVSMVNADFTLLDNTSNLEPDDWEFAFVQWSTDNGDANKGSSVSTTMDSLSRGRTLNAITELTWRYFKNLILNPGILGTRLAMYTMLSILIGGLFWDLGTLTTFTSVQSRIALLFYCVAFFIFMCAPYLFLEDLHVL